MAKVKHYITADGYDPFDAYLRSVKDPIAKAMIATRVARMSTGNYGDCKPCRESVSELRINQGRVTVSISAKSPIRQMAQ